MKWIWKKKRENFHNIFRRKEDSMEMVQVNNEIVVRKYSRGCIFCCSNKDISEFKDMFVCKGCKKLINISIALDTHSVNESCILGEIREVLSIMHKIIMAKHDKEIQEKYKLIEQLKQSQKKDYYHKSRSSSKILRTSFCFL